MRRLIPRRRAVPLEAWEAVLPGVVLPLLALWLGGTEWADRGLAAAANLAPMAVLGVAAWLVGRHLEALRTAAVLGYGVTALGWLGEGTGWEVGLLPLLAEHAALELPLVAAGGAVVVLALVAVGVRLVAGPRPLARH